MIHVTGHTMVGLGYDDATSMMYIHDTWDYSTHTMTWGGTYSGMQHKGVTIVQLAGTPTHPVRLARAARAMGYQASQQIQSCSGAAAAAPMATSTA